MYQQDVEYEAYIDQLVPYIHKVCNVACDGNYDLAEDYVSEIFMMLINHKSVIQEVRNKPGSEGRIRNFIKTAVRNKRADFYKSAENQCFKMGVNTDPSARGAYADGGVGRTLLKNNESPGDRLSQLMHDDSASELIGFIKSIGYLNKQTVEMFLDYTLNGTSFESGYSYEDLAAKYGLKSSGTVKSRLNRIKSDLAKYADRISEIVGYPVNIDRGRRYIYTSPFTHHYKTYKDKKKGLNNVTN